MKPVRRSLALFLFAGAIALQAQTPTITGVSAQPFNSTVLCPGDQVVVNGTNLGTTSTVVTVGSKTAFVKNANANGNQLFIQLPTDAPVGATTITAGASAPFNITLSKFAPAILHDSNNNANAFHASDGSALTAVSPAIPGEQIGISMFGLGPTNPLLPTGVAATNFTTHTTTLPTATIGGKTAQVSDAFATNGQVAVYNVIMNVPLDAGSGLQPIVVSIGGFTSNSVSLPLSTAPVISQVVNAGSYTAKGLPGAEIAQGAIIVVKGVLLGPSTISVATQPFQVTTLAGTTVNVKSGSNTVPLPLYYTLDGQVAALLPSNIPTGAATITVTYGAQTSSPFSFTVVPSQLGIFTVSSDGLGAGIITYPDYSLVSPLKAANCGGPSTTCGAANPGDVLTIWATGLGPITGTDTKGDGLGVDMPNVPLKLFIGGVQANILFHGRGCCVGEDQIAFTVPQNVPTGCAVPLYAQIGSTISNFVVIPIATGSRTCTTTSEILTSANVALLTNSATVTFGDVHLNRVHNPSGYEDDFYANLIQTGFTPSLQPFIGSYVDRNPSGTCMVYPRLNASADPPFANTKILDGGAKLTIQGPGGTVTAGATNNDEYGAVLSSKATYLGPGNYTVSAPGGKDVPAFSTSYTIPTLPVLTSPTPNAASPTVITRANGMTVNWSGGAAGVYVEIQISSATDNNFNTGAVVDCFADSTLHTFTIPGTYLNALPATTFGGIDFLATPFSTVTGVPGLNFVFMNSEFDTWSPLSFK